MLSEATVKTHLGRILTKLELRDRIQAVVFAHQNRLVDQWTFAVFVAEVALA